MNTDEDAELLARLRTTWETLDPPPPGLADRAISTIELADLDAEYELLRLVERSHGLVGVRGDDSAADVISLRSGRLSVVLHVNPVGKTRCNLVGWVDPPQEVSVQILQRELQETVQSDSTGRFELHALESGPTRLVIVVGRSDDDERPPWFATNTLEL